MCSNVIITYGATEIGHVAVGHIDDIAQTPGAIGFLGDWVETRITDGKGSVLPGGQTGRIAFRVPKTMVVDGYLAGHEDDDASFDGEWFLPGDIGYISNNGLLVVTGRVSDLINTGGNKISPEAIETVVAGRHGVLQAGAVGLSNANGFDDVGVAVVGNADLNEARVRRDLEEFLGTQTALRLRVLDGLPSNMGGNLDRAALRALFGAQTG